MQGHELTRGEVCLPSASTRRQCQTQRVCSRAIGQHRASSRLRAAAAEELQGEDLKSVKAVQTQIQGFGFSDEEANTFINKAFAFRKGYWGPEKKQPEIPSTEQVQAVVDYMSELGLNGDDLKSAISKFPEVLGLPVDKRMKANVSKIENEYKIKGATLSNIFKRKPQVLGFNFDCEGDCQGNCSRCWMHM